LGKNFAYRDWYQGISKEWRPYISDVWLRVVAEKDLAVAIGVPLFNEKGEVIGILGLYLGKNQLQKYLSARKQAEEALIEKTKMLGKSEERSLVAEGLAINARYVQALLQLNQMADSTLQEITDFAMAIKKGATFYFTLAQI
jgi:sugar diacid utilization regulator